MRFPTKLAMATAAAALMAGAASAQTLLEVPAAGTGINGTANDVSAPAVIGEGGVTVNLAADSNFLNQNGLLVLQISDATEQFGLGGNPGNVRIDLSGTGFVLNGTPTIGSDTAAVGLGANDDCAEVMFGNIDAGGATGDNFVAWNDVADLQLCDGVTGADLGKITAELPVIMTDTSLGVTASASTTIQVTATGTEASSDELDNLIVEVVESFETAVVADATAPLLLVGTDPAFSAFQGDDGDVGDVAIAQTGGTAVTEIADAANNPVAPPAQIDLTVTFQNATGIAGVTVSGATLTDVALAQSSTTPTMFTASITDATEIANFLADSMPTADPATGPSIDVTLAGDASVASQTVNLTATSLDGNAEEIVSASTSGALANLTREGATEAFEWVGLESAFTRSIFRITGLGDPLPNIFVSASGLNTGEAVTEINIAGTVTATNGELQLTGAQIGTMLGVTPAASGAVRGRVSFTVEAPASQIDIDRAWVNSNGGLTIPEGSIN